MIHFFIEYHPVTHKVIVVKMINGASSIENILIIEDATIKENQITHRLYVIDSEDEQKEKASFPLSLVSILTNHGK